MFDFIYRPDVEADCSAFQPDSHPNAKDNKRVYYKGRIFTIYHSPLGEWVVWWRNHKLHEGETLKDCMYAVVHGMFNLKMPV